MSTILDRNARAKRLHETMVRLDPGDKAEPWATLSEWQREFYRVCVDAVTSETPLEELKRLEKDNEAATEWGAAVGARNERIEGLRSFIDRTKFELVAAFVYSSMKWAAENTKPGEKIPDWVDNGNSMAQDRARSTAQLIIEVIEA